MVEWDDTSHSLLRQKTQCASQHNRHMPFLSRCLISFWLIQPLKEKRREQWNEMNETVRVRVKERDAKSGSEGFFTQETSRQWERNENVGEERTWQKEASQEIRCRCEARRLLLWSVQVCSQLRRDKQTVLSPFYSPSLLWWAYITHDNERREYYTRGSLPVPDFVTRISRSQSPI